jgi:hypothetical protein
MAIAPKNGVAIQASRKPEAPSQSMPVNAEKTHTWKSQPRKRNPASK